ncbi:MAG: methyltransferase domain-containing protein [Acidimicrobiales bacterium]
MSEQAGRGLLDTSTVIALGAIEDARSYDAMIAATAVANGLPLCTCNPADFQGIDGLAVVPIPHPDGVTAPKLERAEAHLAATRRSYDAIAERYDREIGDELLAKPLDRALLDTLAEQCAGGIVADIGCGPGHIAAYLAARGVPVTAVDLSPVMCSLTAKRGVPSAAANMTALPLGSESLAGVICWYAVIHLDTDQRAAAYREINRVLRPGGYALLAFHVSDPDTSPGQAKPLRTWWGHQVELTFRFLHPEQETSLLAEAGLDVLNRTDREPGGTEHPSRRCYLLGRRQSGLT